MIDLYLRADTKEALETCECLRTKDDDGNDVWLTCCPEYALDIVGDDYNADAVFDDDGEIVTPATKRDGYFAMIRCTEEIANTIPTEMIWTGTRPNRIWFKKDE